MKVKKGSEIKNKEDLSFHNFCTGVIISALKRYGVVSAKKERRKFGRYIKKHKKYLYE